MKSEELRVKSEEYKPAVWCRGTVCGNTTKKRHHCARGKSEELRVKSEKYKFKEFGITLISLVITIIILIILAGVAINLSISENGIFTKAKNASEKYKIAQIRETVELGILDVEMKEVNLGNEVTIELILQELLDNKIFESIDKETQIGNIAEYEVKLKYNENGEVVIEYIQKATGVRITYTLEPSTYTNQPKVNIIFKVQGKTKSVSKPNGQKEYPNNNELEIQYEVQANGTYKFTVENEEGKLQEKEVIVDIIDTLPPKEFEITAETTRTGGIKIIANAEDSEADETSVKSGIGRYEYYLKSETESEYTKYDINEIENISIGKYKIYVVAYDKAKNYKKSNEVEVSKINIPDGFEYIEGNIETGIVIRNKIDKNEFVWIPVNDIKDYTRSYEASSMSFSDSLQEDEKNSVQLNKGFYIGRYESGIMEYDSNIETINTNNSTEWTGYKNGKLVIQKEKQVWNYITRDKAIIEAEKLYSKEKGDSVNSKLCSSYAWDTTLKYMETIGSTYPTNSIGGNYSGTVSLTGYDITHPYNIYDMGGNVTEWSLGESYYISGIRKTYPCVAHGGMINGPGELQDSASKRHAYEISEALEEIGFRVTLFL